MNKFDVSLSLIGWAEFQAFSSVGATPTCQPYYICFFFILVVKNFRNIRFNSSLTHVLS